MSFRPFEPPEYNFDVPEAFDEAAIIECLDTLKVIHQNQLLPMLLCLVLLQAQGQQEPSAATFFLSQSKKPYEVPEYDFTTHRRSPRTRRMMPADVVIIEGILVLHSQKIRDMLNMKIYVDTDDDVRLARR